MSDKKILDTLTAVLFMNGHEAIEDFVGYEFSGDEDNDTTVNRIDEAFAQMPPDELQKYLDKYGIKVN